MSTSNAPTVGVVMGSRNDWDTMQHAVARLESLGVRCDVQVVSAHRTPDLLFRYAETAATRGLRVIIAGAAKTAVPVLGVPVQSKALNGIDSLLSIAQMPAGVPVATFAIGAAGAANAGLFAAAILALTDPTIAHSLAQFRARQTQDVLDQLDPRPA